MPDHKLLLATESPHKIRLLKRLLVPFQFEAPAIDESQMQGETVKNMTKRLAQQKVVALSDRYPYHAILATDQSASVGNQILIKPRTFEGAIHALRKISAQTVVFYTSVALSYQGNFRSHTEEAIVKVRPLNEFEIIRYVEQDYPLDCVGAFKIESFGISLFQAVMSQDPTALEGLPLIQVAQWLREIGLMKP